MALDNYRELIDELASFPPLLSEAAAGAADPPEGEWDAAQIVAHLAATDEHWLERINLLLSQRGPLLRSFAEAAGSRADELLANDIEANLQTFADTRGQIVSALMSMTLHDWDRSGVHETLGQRSITDTVEAIADHDAEHLDQLRGY